MSLEHSAPSSIEAKQLAALRSEVEAVRDEMRQMIHGERRERDPKVSMGVVGAWLVALDKALGVEIPKEEP